MFVDTDHSREKLLESAPKPLDLENPQPKSNLYDSASSAAGAGGGEKSQRDGGSGTGHQELTLSYMCENPKMGFLEKEAKGADFLGSLEKGRGGKGKEVALEGSGDEDRRWVERDFLQLGGNTGFKGHGKREGVEVGEGDADGACEGRGKKPKIETLNLSLGPPTLSLSLNPSVPVPKLVAAAAPAVAPSTVDPPATFAAMKRSQSNNTLNTRASSDDFTVSLSQSCSHAFSHNPSCSLTRNSTEYYDYSRDTDTIYYAGEGTNGSVHSRFRPVGDAMNNSVTFSNHGGYPRLLGNNKDAGNSLYRANGSENSSFFPSELPAKKPPKDLTKPGRSDGGQNLVFSRPEQILKEIILEPVPMVAQMLREIPIESVEATKNFLRSLMNEADKRDELVTLQRRLERRSDLTLDTLLKSHEAQLDILVSLKTGLDNFLSQKTRLPIKEMAEIFLLMRCRNVNCNSVLPVEDCDCKLCSNKKGFCSACMCPVCMKFDCANNTCSWVGCDVCSHWCHAICGIQKNLIKPGPKRKGTAGTTEMQFHCPGCGHASEMFGFVKDVFLCCAKDWGLEALKKELNCVMNIFRGSEDLRGKELHTMTHEILTMLEKNLILPSDACDALLQFLKFGISDISIPKNASKDVLVATPLSTLPPKSTYTNPVSLGASRETMFTPKAESKPPEAVLQLTMPKMEGFESLESMVRFKKAEAALFQRLADEARREVENYRQIIQAKTQKLEEEYTNRLAKLCLQETEDRKRKKLEELKLLESSHCDYYKMKMRMEAEMASLLERMEATKQQLA